MAPTGRVRMSQRTVITCGLLALTCPVVSGPARGQQCAPGSVQRATVLGQAHAPDSVTFWVGRNRVVITTAQGNTLGRGRIHKEDGSTGRFGLWMPERTRHFITDVWYVEHHCDLVLISHVQGGESNDIYIERLSGDTLEHEWVNYRYPSYGFGEPLLHGDALYMAGWGSVAKLDLQGGFFAWTHSGIRPDGGVVGGYLPEMRGDTVLFQAEGAIVRVIDSSGELLR